MEGKGSFFVLLFIVAFLSLTLAVLAGYVFFVGGNSSKPAAETSQKETVATKIVESDYSLLSLFDKQIINLKSTDSQKMPVIRLNLKVKYYIGKDTKTGEGKIKPYEEEMKEAAILYFGGITLEDASNKELSMKKAKDDLTKKFNEIVPADEKQKKSEILTVIFDDWFVQ